MIETTVATDLLGKKVSVYRHPGWSSNESTYIYLGTGVVRAVFTKDTTVWLVVQVRSDQPGSGLGNSHYVRQMIPPRGKPFSFLCYANMSEETIVVEDEA